MGNKSVSRIKLVRREKSSVAGGVVLPEDFGSETTKTKKSGLDFWNTKRSAIDSEELSTYPFPSEADGKMIWISTKFDDGSETFSNAVVYTGNGRCNFDKANPGAPSPEYPLVLTGIGRFDLRESNNIYCIGKDIIAVNAQGIKIRDVYGSKLRAKGCEIEDIRETAVADLESCEVQRTNARFGQYNDCDIRGVFTEEPDTHIEMRDCVIGGLYATRPDAKVEIGPGTEIDILRGENRAAQIIFSETSNLRDIIAGARGKRALVQLVDGCESVTINSPWVSFSGVADSTIHNNLGPVETGQALQISDFYGGGRVEGKGCTLVSRWHTGTPNYRSGIIQPTFMRASQKIHLGEKAAVGQMNLFCDRSSDVTAIFDEGSKIDKITAVPPAGAVSVQIDGQVDELEGLGVKNNSKNKVEITLGQKGDISAINDESNCITIKGRFPGWEFARSKKII